MSTAPELPPRPTEETRSQLEPRNKQDSAVWRFVKGTLDLLRHPLMNAAVTIFGLGLGVGLFLGESLRDQEALVEESGGTRHARHSRQRRVDLDHSDAHVPTSASLMPAQ